MQNLQSQTFFERLSYLSDQGKSSAVAQFVMSMVATWLFINANVTTLTSLFWFSCMAIIFIGRFVFSKKTLELIQKNDTVDDEKIQFLTRIHNLGIFASSIGWSIAIFITMNMGEEPFTYGYQMMAVAFAVGIIGVAVSVLSATPTAFYLFAIPLAISTQVALIMTSDHSFQFAMIIGVTIGILFFISASRQFSKRFDESVKKNYIIEQRELELINRLAMASEYRDSETGNHVSRMSYACYLLALEAGFDQKHANLIRIASSMHDIGKLGISDEILLKPGRLNPAERTQIEKHTAIGADILANSESEMIQMAKRIAENHHEKVDGTGYPKGLKGYQIPTEAKIAAICDVFDALTSTRPYKKPWSNEKALAFIIENSGSHFDTQLVQKFMKIYPQIITYAKEHADHLANKTNN